MNRIPLFLSLLALSGCFAHTPVEVGQVEVGSRVRARVSAAEAERLADVLGREQRVLYGRVVGRENGGLLLQVPTTAGQSLGQRVLLTPGDVVALDLRRPDRVRTGALVAGIAAIGGYTAYALFSSSGSGDGDEGPPPNEVLIPIFRWHW